MKKVFTQLDATHQRLLDLLTPLDAKQFAQRPTPNEWSVAEVVHHLCLVEERVIRELEQGLTRPPQTLGWLNRMVPFSLLVGRRVVRVKAPQDVEPLDAPSKEVVIENYNRLRQTIKALSAEHGRERLSCVVLKHPFLGKLNGVKAVRLVGYHEQRHYKQIQKIVRRLD